MNAVLDRLSISVQHTADLPDTTRTALRTFLENVYDGDFADEDWDHALGGLHTLAFLEGRLVGHAAVVQRTFVIGDQARRVGYLEAMGVHPDLQRSGVGRAMMDRVNAQVTKGYDFGALSASEQGFGLYRASGWVVWQGALRVMTLNGTHHTPEDAGSVLVYDDSGRLNLHEPLISDYRSGDVW